jgi:hypothetical protein
MTEISELSFSLVEATWAEHRHVIDGKSTTGEAP